MCSLKFLSCYSSYTLVLYFQQPFYNASSLTDASVCFGWCSFLYSSHKDLGFYQFVGWFTLNIFRIILAYFLGVLKCWWCRMFFLLATAVRSAILKRFNDPYIVLGALSMLFDAYLKCDISTGLSSKSCSFIAQCFTLTSCLNLWW